MIHAGYRHISFRTPSETRLSCRIARSARRVNGEAARINFLHNALGQRVFKGEPQAEQTLPSEAQLGQDFITWLKKQFGWLFAQAQANTSVGTAYTFGDGPIPGWAILGEYDNGSAKGAGRSEYIWLPTEDGAIPVGMFRNGKFFAIHSDHLGTPRLMTSEANQPVWQWPYSAFGDNKPTGVLRATPNPKAAITNIPVLLKATSATELNLRFPGQYDDAETGTFYNYQRQYLASQGRYTRGDPIGLEGGLNRFGYAEGNPASFFDPLGLMGQGSGANGRTPKWGKGGPCKCPTPPPGPPGACIADNVDIAKDYPAWNPFSLAGLYDNVKNHGPWDYKRRGTQYEDFGNFNFGAVTAAMGVSAYTAQNGAGIYQQWKGAAAAGSGIPLLRWPYGDDLKDAVEIERGRQYAKCRCRQ